MPRLQVMHLPAPADEYPFLLIIDKVGDLDGLGDLSNIRQDSGAQAVLVFADEVEVA